MRVGATIPKMATKDPVAEDKPTPRGTSPAPAATALRAAASAVASLSLSGTRRPMTTTGSSSRKRTSRDDDPSTGTPMVEALDPTAVSALCHQLLEKKRRMMSAVEESARVSDDEPSENVPDHHNTTAPSGGGSGGRTRGAMVVTGDLSEEDILRQKALRRREQVRAASRRCRDRQRRETEELRMKVFQLEEFITHTLQTYETELRRQRERSELVERENDVLRRRLTEMEAQYASHAAAIPPVDPTSYPPSSMEDPQANINHQNAAAPEEDTSNIVWDFARIQNVDVTVAQAKQTMISILTSTMPLAIHRQAFGWDFDFWDIGNQYFVRTSKFFRGMRAQDLADRFFNVDPQRYMETFHEVKDKKVLGRRGPNIKFVQTVKDLPGKSVVASVTCDFNLRDENFDGDRWVVGVISVGSPQHLRLTDEDECNGYIFEDGIHITSDGEEIHGCYAQGAGRFDCRGKEIKLMMEELAKVFASVVIRWESLFINDYMGDFEDEVDAETEEIVELGITDEIIKSEF